MTVKTTDDAHARIRYVILDRDGTLIRHIPYLCDPQQVELLPGVRQGLKLLREAGCLLFLHTNQSGIGRGYYTPDDAHVCNDEMIAQIGMGPDIFADICVAPELPDEVQLYRKPSPAFAQELAERLSAVADQFCYVGDNPTDLMTASAFGCMGIGVNTGLLDLPGELAERNLLAEFPVCSSFEEAARLVLEIGAAQ